MRALWQSRVDVMTLAVRRLERTRAHPDASASYQNQLSETIDLSPRALTHVSASQFLSHTSMRLAVRSAASWIRTGIYVWQTVLMFGTHIYDA